MNKSQKILKRREEFNIVEVYKARQDKLAKLVDEHGVEDVALAGDWTENTVKQYLRARVAPSISDVKLLQAEKVLEGL